MPYSCFGNLRPGPILVDITIDIVISVLETKSCVTVRDQKAIFSVLAYLQLCGFSSERFYLPLGAWDGLHYFLWHSLSIPYNYFGFVKVDGMYRSGFR